jgi:hypothetical protein
MRRARTVACIAAMAAVPLGAAMACSRSDDGGPAHPWHECRTDNNVSDPADPACDTVN